MTRNTSPRVDPDDCRTCGKCCKDLHFRIKKGFPREVYEQLILMHYRAGVQSHFIEGSEEAPTEYIDLQIDHPCRYLVEENGMYSCKIVDSGARPLICSLFPYPETTPDQCPHLKGGGS